MNDAVTLPSGSELLGPPERLHPLYLLTGLGPTVKGAWGVVAGGAYFATQGNWWAAAAMVGAFAAYSIGSHFLRWLKLEYRVGPDEIRIDSGFLSRTSRAIPFDRVTDIDLEQGPLHRLFGLARVRLETGASAGSGQEDGVLHTISLARAEALRQHIRVRRERQAAAPVEVKAETDLPVLFIMDGRRVAIAGFFNFSLAVIAGLFGVSQTIGDVIGFDPFKRAFWIDLLDKPGPVRNLVIAHQIVAVLGGSLLLVLLGIGTGLVRTTLREYGFRLDRTESGLRRRRGLLTLTDVTIPARRVQAAILATGPIRRAFGWWDLRLQSLAQDGGKGDHVVAPLARQQEAAHILASLGRPAGPERQSWRPVSKAYLTSFVIVVAVPAAMAGLASLPFLGAAALAWPAGAALAIAVRWFDWRGTRYALAESTLFVETGWWRHRRNIVPAAKIQSIDLAENFWSRAFGICTLRLGVAGGSGFSNHHIPALPRADAEALRARLIPS